MRLIMNTDDEGRCISDRVGRTKSPAIAVASAAHASAGSMPPVSPMTCDHNNVDAGYRLEHFSVSFHGARGVRLLSRNLVEHFCNAITRARNDAQL